MQWKLNKQIHDRPYPGLPVRLLLAGRRAVCMRSWAEPAAIRPANQVDFSLLFNNMFFCESTPIRNDNKLRYDVLTCLLNFVYYFCMLSSAFSINPERHLDVLGQQLYVELHTLRYYESYVLMLWWVFYQFWIYVSALSTIMNYILKLRSVWRRLFWRMNRTWPRNSCTSR